MSVRSFALLAVAMVAVAGAAFAWGGPWRPVAVSVVVPQASAKLEVYGLGTVEARQLSHLGFDASGVLVALTADQWDRVPAGTVMAGLDAGEQRARLARAEADLAQADAAVAQAEARVERARVVVAQKQSIHRRRQSLLGGGTVSREIAEDAEAEARTAAADVIVAERDLEAARAARQSAEAQRALEREGLAKLDLKTPYDALVVARSRELGSIIAPGTAVFTVVDPDTIWVRAYVDEALAGSLAVGQRAAVTLRSRPGDSLAGHIARIDVESDRVAEERIVNIAFDQVPRPFHLGEQAEVLVTVGGTGLTLPATAVDHPSSLWVVENDTARRRPVRLGRMFADGRVEVLQGVGADDRVIVSAAASLSDGRSVAVESRP